MAKENYDEVKFPSLIDLISEDYGGRTLFASDEFFAEKENLLKEGRGIFIEDKYTENGKWMDGWESRRRRDDNYDYCIIKTGINGTIKNLVIDTNHFLGNHPPFASVDGCVAPESEDLEDLKNSSWENILPSSPLYSGSQNLFSVNPTKIYKYLRLNIFPCGGVARFRALGTASPDTTGANAMDLAAVVNGGRVVFSSDMFFGSMHNLIQPNPGKNMGDGWETKRKRISGNDWCLIRLAMPGKIEKIEVDTNHFNGNFPDSFSLEAGYFPEIPDHELLMNKQNWTEILSPKKLKAHDQASFTDLKNNDRVFSHVKLHIYPDGGVSRLRVWGKPSK